MYRILSIDGGGLRGIIAGRIIQRLNEKTNFLESLDMIAGTSTGGIIALGLAAGKPIEEIIDLYVKKGKEIFSRNIFGLRTLIGSTYTNKYLAKNLKEFFGHTRLCDLKKKVAIPAFKLDGPANGVRTWKPKIFHNFEYSEDYKNRAAKIALYTSSAPTYFPTADGYIDGGVIANNPSMIAIAQAIANDIPLSNISLISIGTGFNPAYIEGDHNWGYSQWIKSLVNILLDGTILCPDFQARQLLGDRYTRIQPVLSENIEMDDINAIDEMDKVGRESIIY